MDKIDAEEGITTTNENSFTVKGFLIFLLAVWSIFISVILMVQLWRVIF